MSSVKGVFNNYDFGGFLQRFSKIIGHMNSTKRMLENKKDMYDVIMQLSAVEAATKSLRRYMLRQYFEIALKEDVKKGSNKVVRRISTTIDQIIR